MWNEKAFMFAKHFMVYLFSPRMTFSSYRLNDEYHFSVLVRGGKVMFHCTVGTVSHYRSDMHRHFMM